MTRIPACLLLICPAVLAGNVGASLLSEWKSPPPASPLRWQESPGKEGQVARARALAAPAGASQYSIGNPTDQEQLYLEYVNRARLDPAAEALRLQSTTNADLVANYRFHHVDLALMAQQVSSLNPAAPLSMNAQLSAAARAHSQDMLEHGFQGHEGSDGSTFDTRATAAGYQWTTIAENVFSSARSVEHGHAGFEVDWGGTGDPADGGMQNPPGHRLNIHSTTVREIGIGVIEGTNGDTGPQVVTQDFGNRPGLTPFVTGVVFYDLNTNNFYDIGEGIGGVRVSVEGSTSYAITARSGGYSVPVSGGRDYKVSFNVPGLPDAPVTITVATDNVKVDHVLAYAPPVLAGPDAPGVNQANLFTFNPVGGATGYQWKQANRIAAPEPEGAENGLTQVIASTAGSYSVIDSAVRASGENAFHLAHPRSDGTNSPPADQYLELNRVFRAGSAAVLTFASRLGWATSDQVARAQVSTDDGLSWQDVWAQSGSNGEGETGFTTRNVPLPGLADREFRLRFAFDFVGGGFFEETSAGVGFYIDDIAFQGAEELVNESISEIPTGTAFQFTPTEVGSFALSVRPRVGERLLPWGPAKLVAAREGSALSVRLTGTKRLDDGRISFVLMVTNSGSAAYRVEAAEEVIGPWSEQDGASIEPGGTPGTFEALVPTSTSSRRFYRVVTTDSGG